MRFRGQFQQHIDVEARSTVLTTYLKDLPEGSNNVFHLEELERIIQALSSEEIKRQILSCSSHSYILYHLKKEIKRRIEGGME